MAIELIQFPKSHEEGDASPPDATVNEFWAGAAFSVGFTLLGLALLAPLWGPRLSDSLLENVAQEKVPAYRTVLSVAAWCARHGFAVCLWLAAANGLAYLGFAVSVVRIDQVMRGQPIRGLAHLDGGLMDLLARIMCLLGGGPGGFMALAAYARFRFAYPYRYARCGMALASIFINLAVPGFYLAVISSVISARPDYDEQFLTRPYWEAVDETTFSQEEFDREK